MLSTIGENTPSAWLIALGVGLLCYLFLHCLLRLLISRLVRLDTPESRNWAGIFAKSLSAIRAVTLIYVSVYAASSNLDLHAKIKTMLEHGFEIILFVQLGLWGNRAIWAWMEQRSKLIASHGDNSSLSSLNVFKVMAQIMLWITVLLLLLANLGFNVGALMASLGVGGVAIALALQNILGDLFASLSIALDKPFVVGDDIQVDDYSGTVTRIGLKTTRVQSSGGEELIFSNGDLLRSRVRNFKRMSERRIVCKFNVTYDTKPDQIDKINAIVKQAIEAQAKTRFDRVHLKNLGESSLEFEAVYFMTEKNYLSFMDAQQAINISLLTKFAEAGIQFSFPTRTVNITSLPKQINA